ncbi:hypothetical protein IU449_03670 [Nocardia higoensis]|uniref:Transposase n=1 Tax=Nocardia higoensis TaxID=228599 RepID=A0ABS0D597_9NOCA|nr:hypothetical protein [Nocardia higoensis]MBF6353655.1 hypothetical protein [Nocardia higoensis]
MAFIRKVRTASGATAVQIAEKNGRRNKILEHVGSAHTDAELAALVETARARLLAGQQKLDLDMGGVEPGAARITGKRARWLIEAVTTGWREQVASRSAFLSFSSFRLQQEDADEHVCASNPHLLLNGPERRLAHPARLTD